MEANNFETVQNLANGSSLSAISYADAMENYRKNTDWWVVFAAFDLPGFQSSPLWISQRLNLGIETVIEALEGLVLLGYLTKASAGYEKIKGKEFVSVKPNDRKKADVIEEHSLISAQVLNQLNEGAIMAIDHRCFASDVDTLKELYFDINAAMEKAYKNSMRVSAKDRIFKMSFTAVDVLPGRQ